MLIEGLSNEGTGMPKNIYKYTDKEWQNDLKQNLLDFGWRQYDPVIARWHVTDPAEQFYNPYLAICANPVSFIDPDGRKGGVSNGPGGLDLLPGLDDGIGGGSLGGGGGGVGGSSWGLTKMQALIAQEMYAMPEFNNEFGVLNSDATMSSLCSTCSTNELNNGAIIISNTNTGAVVGVIEGANTNYSNTNNNSGSYYSIQNGQFGVMMNGEFRAIEGEYVQQDGLFNLQGGIQQKNFKSLTNAERTSHIFAAIRHANLHGNGTVNIDQIFSNFDKNSSSMMGQGFNSGLVKIPVGDRILEVQVDFAIYGNLKGGYNPIIDFSGGQAVDRVIHGRNWVIFKNSGFHWGTTSKDFDYLYRVLGY